MHLVVEAPLDGAADLGQIRLGAALEAVHHRAKAVEHDRRVLSHLRMPATLVNRLSGSERFVLARSSVSHMLRQGGTACSALKQVPDWLIYETHLLLEGVQDAVDEQLLQPRVNVRCAQILHHLRMCMAMRISHMQLACYFRGRAHLRPAHSGSRREVLHNTCSPRATAQRV